MPVRIVERPAQHLVGLSGQFTPQTTPEIPALWGRFVQRMHEIQGWTGRTTYGICRMIAGPLLEYAAAVPVENPMPVPDGLAAFTLPAGSFAVFTHHGHIREIGKTWDRIWDTEMKGSGLRHRDGQYDFELYDERWNPQTGEGDVDIYIAISPEV